MKSTYKLPGKSIARVILALFMVIATLVCSSYITIQITRQRLNNFAETMAEHQSAYVNTVASMTFVANEWIINSFMAGISDLDCPHVNFPNHTKETRYLFSDRTLSRLTTDDIFERLESFIRYHDDYSSVVMIFEPGVLQDAPAGIAAKVSPRDSTRYNLCDNYNVFDNKFYREVKDTDMIISMAGLSDEDSLFLSTVGVPLYDHHGRFIGEFWLNTDAKRYSDILEFYKSDDDVIASLVNTNCRIIASTYRDKNGQYIKDVTEQACNGHFPTEWYSQLQECLKRNESSHFRYSFDGEPMVTYVFPISSSPYRLLIVKPESRLYSRVQRFIWLPIFILVFNIILVSLCLLYLYSVIKRKNDESARMEGELNVAAIIQRSILPINPTAAPAFDIYGFQHPAKTVGGDLYDFAQKGNLMHFCIGDVSGKGMPAALVMTELCSLYRYIITNCSDPREIVSRINNAIMERSDDSMFCTLFVGVLNLDNGLLTFCNAGHNPPVFISDTTSFLKIKPNMPINAFKDYDYQSETLQMKKSDRLFLYTDGVNEAKNRAGRFYGNDATLSTVDSHKALPFSRMIDSILHDLKQFTQKAEQHDDITMLCLEYKSSILHFDNVKGRVVEIVNETLDSCSLPDDMKLRLAVEESVQNISDYAYPTDGPLDIRISRGNDFVEITLTDNGKPFNPLDTKAPDLSVPILEREEGGLGIFLTLQTMSEVSYSYENNQNNLILKYKII